MGEQSNAYRILLRYDRKSRHRRIKKQRRYERLAATSQFRTTSAAGKWRRPPSSAGVCETCVAEGTLSGGRSPYLKPDTAVSDPHLGERWTPQLVSPHAHALCKHKHRARTAGRGSRVVLRIVSIQTGCNPSILGALRAVVLPAAFGTVGLTRVPRIQVCCPLSPPAYRRI